VFRYLSLHISRFTKMNSAGFGMTNSASAFDPMTFIKRPSVIARFVCLLLAILIMACISGGGYYTMQSGQVCLFGSGEGGGPCGWGIALAVFAMLASGGFLVVSEVYFARVSNANTRRQIVICDLAVAALFTVLTFLTFCIMTSAWGTELPDYFVYDKNPCRAALAFYFFSIISWGAVSYLVFRTYREGVSTAFAPTYEHNFGGAGHMPNAAPYAAGSAGTVDSYQEPPFSNAPRTQSNINKQPY